jgi:hypothetical protein
MALIWLDQITSIAAQYEENKARSWLSPAANGAGVVN